MKAWGSLTEQLLETMASHSVAFPMWNLALQRVSDVIMEEKHENMQVTHGLRRCYTHHTCKEAFETKCQEYCPPEFLFSTILTLWINPICVKSSAIYIREEKVESYTEPSENYHLAIPIAVLLQET